jgi:plasmid stabilization system protein ParE
VAHKVIWAPAAIEDLIAIGEYIERDSPFNAKMVVSRFYELASKYGRFPRASTIVPELNNELYRHKIVFGWRVIYKINDLDKSLAIISILHSKRQFINIQGRFLE